MAIPFLEGETSHFFVVKSSSNNKYITMIISVNVTIEIFEIQ